MKRFLIGPVAAVTALTCSVPAPAQQTLPAARRCFVGAPRPACSSFAIVEAGYAYPIVRHPGRLGGTPLDITWHLGCMSNISARAALGATLYGGVDLDRAQFRVALLPRYRRWLSTRWSLELSAGPAWAAGWLDSPATIRLEGTGVAAEAALTWGDLVGVASEFEVLPRTQFNPNGLLWHVGVKLGSGPAVLGLLADAVYAAAKSLKSFKPI